MTCPVCQKTNSIIDPQYGVLPCLDCQHKQAQYYQPKVTIEMTTEEIKHSRKEFASDIVQPFRDGVLSKEYLQAHGTKRIEVSKKDIKNAKNVWKENSYYQK